MKILVTGACGFIGSSLVDFLLAAKHEVVGIDNFDDFYSRQIKESNIRGAKGHTNFKFLELDICAKSTWEKLSSFHFDAIIHLAAKAGVRPSIEKPIEYNEVNIIGSHRMLEFAKKQGIKKIIFASSSSVYGVNKNLPWSVADASLQPISIYAFSKLTGEQLCRYYHENFQLNITVLRFFTVIGPRQRPDLVIHKFVKSILQDKEITLFGQGNTFRDYTFIGDIVAGIVSALNYEHTGFEMFNLGNTHTVGLLELVQIIEELLDKKAKITYLPEQQGDVPYTWSDIGKTTELLNYHPATNIKEGISKFIDWYKKEVMQ